MHVEKFMKVDIAVEVVDSVVDSVVVSWIKDNLKMIEGSDGYLHPDDVKYNKKLVKAFKRVLDYVGEGNEET